MEEGRKSGTPCIGKSTPTREGEAGMPSKGKSAGRRKEVEKSRGGKSGVPCTGKSTARVEEDLGGKAEDKSRGVLWERHPRRGTVIRARVDDERSSSLVPSL